MRNIKLLLLASTMLGSLARSPAYAQAVPATDLKEGQSKAGEASKPAEAKDTTVPVLPQDTSKEASPVAAPSRDVRTPIPTPRARNMAPPKPRTDSSSAFIIGPEDVLLVRVWDEPGLSGQVIVGPDGMISMQLIHEVKAAGLTTVQLEAALTEQFKLYRNNPDVSVAVASVRSRKFLIQGGMGRTGTFPLTGPTTMLEALANGGGFKEFANPKKIYVLRTKPDGTTEKLKFNYKEVSQGRHMETNFLVQNGDQIFVPE